MVYSPCLLQQHKKVKLFLKHKKIQAVKVIVQMSQLETYSLQEKPY